MKFYIIDEINMVEINILFLNLQPKWSRLFRLDTILFVLLRLQVLNDVREGIKYFFQTKNPITLVISGTGKFNKKIIFINIINRRDLRPNHRDLKFIRDFILYSSHIYSFVCFITIFTTKIPSTVNNINYNIRHGI